MKILQKICFVLLLGTFSSVYGVSCWDRNIDVDDCRVRAEQGGSDDQLILGNLYDQGNGVPQDHKEAVKWYRLAAEQGNGHAQTKLGWMYYYGKGVSQDYKKSVRWWKRRAAESGFFKAHYDLGYMYFLGRGVPKDYVMAHMHFNLASASAVSGYPDAVKNRGIVETKMSPPQIEKAQALARKWEKEFKEKMNDSGEGPSLHNDISPIPNYVLPISNEVFGELSTNEKNQKKNEIALVKGAVKTFIPYLFGYLFFFFITKQRNPFSKPVDIEQRPKWLFSLILAFDIVATGTHTVNINDGDFLGYLVIKSLLFFIGVVFATFVFFIYRWRVRRNTR